MEAFQTDGISEQQRASPIIKDGTGGGSFGVVYYNGTLTTPMAGLAMLRHMHPQVKNGPALPPTPSALPAHHGRAIAASVCRPPPPVLQIVQS